MVALGVKMLATVAIMVETKVALEVTIVSSMVIIIVVTMLAL